MGRADHREARRIVVKVGTSVITSESGRLDSAQLKNLVRQIAELTGRGHEILLVSSGAIAAGVEGLGLAARPTAIPELQAAASVGQGLLVHEYAKLFAEHGLRVGQVLLTQHDTAHREHYLNARNTLNTLLELGAVPVINENDTTAVDEIRFGDNDTLAALVSNLAEADLLILLSDTEGLCSGDPRCGGGSVLLQEVREITPEIDAIAGGAGTRFGSGGMVTKVQAAKIVTFGGIAMVIADGRRPNVLLDIADGKPVGTLFHPMKKAAGSRKLWIAFGKMAAGTLLVDEGAKKALAKQGKSLLPAGIVECRGDFKVGDAVEIADREGRVFAKGLTNYSSAEVDRIKGLRSDAVLAALPEASDEEVVHRDYLVILESEV